MALLRPALLIPFVLLAAPFAACFGPAEGEQIEVSPVLSKGESWSYTFQEPGTYSIRCRPHPHMRQTIRVVEPGQEAPGEATNETGMKDLQYQPAEIVVEAGETVTWTNQDRAGHDVTIHRAGEDK